MAQENPEDHLEDHAIGLELQITELVERRERAVVQGDPDRAATLDSEIEALQEELVETSDQIADPHHHPVELHAPEVDESFEDL